MGGTNNGPGMIIHKTRFTGLAQEYEKHDAGDAEINQVRDAFFC